MKKENLFEGVPDILSEEIFETLGKGKGEFFIERIVSDGHRSSAGFWYDQETTEWVVLLKGSAEIQFRDSEENVVLRPGDWLEIPARVEHRVESTSPTEKTFWLAVHWRG